MCLCSAVMLLSMTLSSLAPTPYGCFMLIQTTGRHKEFAPPCLVISYPKLRSPTPVSSSSSPLGILRLLNLPLHRISSWLFGILTQCLGLRSLRWKRQVFGGMAIRLAIKVSSIVWKHER